MPNQNARRLRKTKTDAETALWRHLRERQLEGFRFRRQVPIGPYIVDFACMEARLIVEVDGGQHSAGAERDGKRDSWLENVGYRVMRFWNNDVLSNRLGVLTAISEVLKLSETAE